MGRRGWKIKELLKVTAGYLLDKSIDSPRLTAELLLAHLLKTDRIGLYMNLDLPLTDEELAGYRSLVRRRLKHEPLQYITGKQEFWSLEFVVNQHVLIPRPETEILVERAVALGRDLLRGKGILNVLDLGTGCGAIAVCAAKELENTEIWATDVSRKALEVARLNAKRHGVEGKIHFLVGDLWTPLAGRNLGFDLLLSNPPYVPSDKIGTLAPEVRDYEPGTALDGGPGGLRYIEEILLGAHRHMNPGAWLLVEMDPCQMKRAIELLGSVPDYTQVEKVKDYSHRDRVLLAQKGSQKSYG